ncbi:MAG: hypothetical protein OEM49_08345 [Myxococcales bacterium]|nr:hypothetical protein [Myxococcales bacterium]
MSVLRSIAFGLAGAATALLATSAVAEEAVERRVWWHPSLQLQGVADDNAFLEDGGSAGDVGFWLTPRLELGVRAPSYEVGADLGVDVRRHSQHQDYDETFARVSGFGEIGLLPGLSLRVSDAFVPQPVRLGLPDDQPSNLLQSNRLEGSLRYWRAGPDGREIAFGVKGARFDSESFAALVPGPGGAPLPDPDFDADFWEGGGFLELQSALTRRASVYLAGTARYRTFDESPQSDLGEYTAIAGLRMQRLRGLQLDVAGGGGVLDFRSGRSVPRFLGRFDLGYRHRSGWRLGVGGQHRFTADLAGNDFIDTTGRLTLERYFGTRTAATLTLFASYLQDESQALQSDPLARRNNFFGGVELALRRQLARQLQIGLAYRYWENAGSFGADDFQQNRGMLTLIYRE